MAETILWALATFVVGFAGALLLKKSGLPTAWMTGSMLAVLVFSVATGNAYFPAQAKNVVQTIAGAALGASVSREAVAGLRATAAPLVVYLASLTLNALLFAVIMTLATSLTPVTALLSCAPGGVTEMSLISYDFDAAPSQVSILHMSRLLVALGLFPYINQAFLRRFGTTNNGEAAAAPVRADKPPVSFRGNILPTFLIMTAGAVVGRVSGLPSGVLTCSMLAVAAFQLGTGRACMPIKVKRVAQVAAGAIVASTMTMEDVLGLWKLILPFCIMLVEYLILNYGIGPLIARRFGIDMTTILLACTPAGVSDMALVAGDMGGDQAKVAVFQLSRLTFVLVTFPYFARLFALWPW